VVSAAAGSGKTSTLAARFLALVEAGLPADSILTVTFTNAAAIRMKREIVAILREAGRYEDAQLAETGPIQTLHSYCERLLRENAVDAGLDPAFTVGDDRVSQWILLAIRESVAALARRHSDYETLVRSFAGEGTWDAQTRRLLWPHRSLVATVRSLLEHLRSWTFPPEWFEHHYASAESVMALWQERLPPRFGLDPAASPEELESGLMKTLRARSVEDDALWDAARSTSVTVRFCLEVWRRLEVRFAAERTLDYAALERRAVQLLTDDPELRQRLRHRYRAAMVDESQDLNPVQHALLRALDPEDLLFVGDRQQSIYSFRNADVDEFTRQSVRCQTLHLSRNFRAEPPLIRLVNRVFEKQWGEDYLVMSPPNGTSTEAGAEFDLDGPAQMPKSGDLYAGFERWEVPSQGWYDAVAAGVLQLIDEGTPAREIAVLVRSADDARQVKRALSGADVATELVAGDFFLQRMEVRDLANILQLFVSPDDDFAALATLGGPGVGLSLDALVLLAKRREVLSELKRPDLDLEPADTERVRQFLGWFEPLQRDSDRRAAWELLGALFADSPLLENLAARADDGAALDAVRRLLRAAAERPEYGPDDMVRWIRDEQQMPNRERNRPTDEDESTGVTIMTLHAAKGLEFPTVVVASPSKYPKVNSGQVSYDAHSGCVVARYPNQPSSVAERALKQLRLMAELDEHARLLYVAMTRARRRLCIAVCGPRDAQDRSFSVLLRNALGKDPLPGEIRRSLAN
jgi:ATP-dependent exoDNAse (exonuclease V) beta subunit